MSTFRLLCYLPAERAYLSSTIFSANAIPVIDICCGDRVAIPKGAWVRTRSKRGIPGKGPIILAGGHHRTAIRGRETWLEVTAPRKVPRGFAGIIIRAAETGGWSGDKSIWGSLEKCEPDKTILDGGLLPEEMSRLRDHGFIGTVISDVLVGFSEFSLPPRLSSFLRGLEPAGLLHANDYSICTPPLSSGAKNLLRGTDWWRVSADWFREDNPSSYPPPWGKMALHAREIAGAHKTIEHLLHTYQQEDSVPAVSRVIEKIIEVEKVVEKVIDPPAQDSSTLNVTVDQASQEPIAIIGMGCRLPKANSLQDFQHLLDNGLSAIQEVPNQRWDWNLFWDSDRKAPDKTYSKIGGFLQDFVFHSKRFRIPPKVATQVDAVQQIALESVADALEDAGYDPRKNPNNSRVAVILGNSMGGENTDDFTIRTRLPETLESLKKSSVFKQLSLIQQQQLIEDVQQNVKANLPTITEDSMPGELANVIAGRIANAFDLHGPNYTIDAACASSMAAIQAAVKGLRDNEFDMVVTGGADRSMGVPTYVKFCKIGALSAEHSAPFDQRANGFVMGEGCGILVLKRLSDAKRDNDRIYATIRGIGASSDGKGKGITAPNPRGQRLAIRRAYENAQFAIQTVDYIECHGTSTIVGDKVEVDVLSEIVGAGNNVRIGSVKSNIGHLKSAAGAAAMIKAALSIYNRRLYPSINYKEPRVDLPANVVQVQRYAEDWSSSNPRRAGVSAFGFGGTNFHIVLEESRETTISIVEQPAVQPTNQQSISALPDSIWEISGQNNDEILQKIDNQEFVSAPNDPIRVVGASQSSEEYASQIERLIQTLKLNRNPGTLRGRGIFVEKEAERGKVAFVFTGQGSQYLNMGMALAEKYPIVAQTFDEADGILLEEIGGSLRSFITPNPDLSEEEQFKRLQATEIAQPATLTIDIAIMRLLGEFGVRPDMVAGHSLGEYSAAVAAGVLSFTDALIAVSARGREMAAVKIDDVGKMARSKM